MHCGSRQETGGYLNCLRKRLRRESDRMLDPIIMVALFMDGGKFGTRERVMKMKMSSLCCVSEGD